MASTKIEPKSTITQLQVYIVWIDIFAHDIRTSKYADNYVVGEPDIVPTLYTASRRIYDSRVVHAFCTL